MSELESGRMGMSGGDSATAGLNPIRRNRTEAQVHSTDPAPLPAVMAGEWHVGRSWTTHEIEDACPCPKAPCGLVTQTRTAPECEHHPITRGRTLRQGHSLANCPGGA